MRDYLSRVASFDPKYINENNHTVSLFAAICGALQLILTACAFASYTYVGYLLTNNEVEAIMIGAIFSFFIFLFYRLSLLISSRYEYCSDTMKKVNILSTVIKLLFMSLNILFFIYAFEMLLLKDTLDELMLQYQAPDGIISRMRILSDKLKWANFLTILFYIIFMSPIIGRYLISSLSAAYDYNKTKHEQKFIKDNYNNFIEVYTHWIQTHSQGKAAEIIYHQMKNPPFDMSLEKKPIATVVEDELFTYLDQKIKTP
jgi:hypothetical protein